MNGTSLHSVPPKVFWVFLHGVTKKKKKTDLQARVPKPGMKRQSGPKNARSNRTWAWPDA